MWVRSSVPFHLCCTCLWCVNVCVCRVQVLQVLRVCGDGTMALPFLGVSVSPTPCLLVEDALVCSNYLLNPLLEFFVASVSRTRGAEYYQSQ